MAAPPESGSTPTTPCGACKFLRRKCVKGCIFAPHFSSDQGAALFAAVHKVFGASNVSKLLMHLPVHWRNHAVVTISYEAQARLSDPVYGCVSTVVALKQQVAALQAELAMVQNQLINNRVMAANALQGSLQQPQAVHHPRWLQPEYSNASNNNMINMSSFQSSQNNLAGDHQTAVDLQPSFDPLQFSRPYGENGEGSGDLLAFAEQMFHPR
ncbi:LOB domain-containing protein 20-like [Cynara cardunculus var. scolymus]|uniref:LOB domain-containing protein 20-like n=1 Tax=Cynara cardunculus var. scolymus TaxID=59895 RepID=UPI000D625A27|nr:LOB domain-containing protein 20-like [Cynara cardunculus var. scolymus]